MKLPQLSLRDLFWLVALAALICAWLSERHRRVAWESSYHDLSARHMSLIDGLCEEGIDFHLDPASGETQLQKIGPGKDRRDAQRAQLNAELQSLPELEITTGKP